MDAQVDPLTGNAILSAIVDNYDEYQSGKELEARSASVMLGTQRIVMRVVFSKAPDASPVEG